MGPVPFVGDRKDRRETGGGQTCESTCCVPRIATRGLRLLSCCSIPGFGGRGLELSSSHLDHVVHVHSSVCECVCTSMGVHSCVCTCVYNHVPCPYFATLPKGAWPSGMDSLFWPGQPRDGGAPGDLCQPRARPPVLGLPLYLPQLPVLAPDLHTLGTEFKRSFKILGLY